MAEKVFVNNTLATFQVTLFVREGEFPFNQDGTVTFTLLPGETENVTFGSDTNMFLNGLTIFTIFEGDLFSSVKFVTARMSELDNLLNTNNTITISKEQTDYVLTGSNQA